MVMNHYKTPKRFYVRTKVWYTTEPRQQLYPLTIGNCAHLANGMSYDVPGGGAPGSTYVDRSTWTVPFSGRILGAGSHHHGGALHQTLRSAVCGRTLFDAKAYYGADDHPYNTIRPILHEPGPIANGTFRTLQGIPVTPGRGARARGRALQRGAARGGDGLLGAVRSSATTAWRRVRRCRRTCARSRVPREVRPARAVRLRPARAAAVRARAGAGSRSRRSRPGRRPVVQPQRLTAKRRAEDHLALRGRRAAQRDAWPTGRAASPPTTSA